MSVRWMLREICCKSNLQRKLFSSATCAGSTGSSSVTPRHFQVLGYKGKFWLDTNAFHDIGFKFHHERSITNEEQVDPFALVADELGMLANRLRSMIVTEIPKLATAAEYFFKMGVEGKKFRPMVLLLMASSLTMAMPEMAIDSVREGLAKERRLRQQRIAEITEMIHLAVLAGDFLLSRASVALASLKNTEVVELLSKVLEDLVTGEIMQMTSSSEQCCSMEYYMRKTFYKTASLMANSCKAVALLGGQPAEVCMLAYDYGRHLGLAFQLVDDVLDFTGTAASLGKGSLSDIRQGIITAPLLFALEEFPQLKGIIDRKFKNPGDIDLALEFLGKSEGIRKTKQLAVEHAHHAASAIDSLPPSELENVRICRKALVDLTEKVITRTK